MLVKMGQDAVQTSMETIIVCVLRDIEESFVRLTMMIVYRHHAKIQLCVKTRLMTMNVCVANLELLENTASFVKVILGSVLMNAPMAAFVGEIIPQL